MEATEVVPAALDGERLDRVVAIATGSSRAAVSDLVAAGAVTVDGLVETDRRRRLYEGEVVAVAWEPAGGDTPPSADPTVELTVVHEDDAVLVIDKPPGLVVHPGAGNADGTLVAGLLARYPEIAHVGDDPMRPGIVHRLDKETSGLLVVARTPQAYESLVEQLAARDVRREYLALAWGSFDVPAGSIDAPVGRSRRNPTKMAVSERGREARTHYAVERAFTQPVEVTLLRCTLETGRTHQIRVHLAAIDHPVVGDERYRGVRQSLTVPRLFLHAATLAFAHPVSGEEVVCSAALPEDLATVVAGLA